MGSYGKWLNDEIINRYGVLLGQIKTDQLVLNGWLWASVMNPEKPQIEVVKLLKHQVSTCSFKFWTTVIWLYFPQLCQKNYHDSAKSGMYQWKFIYFPINYENSHWALGKIDTANQAFVLMDNMQSKERFKAFSNDVKVCPSIVDNWFFDPSLTTEYFHRLFCGIWVCRSSWKTGRS